MNPVLEHRYGKITISNHMIRNNSEALQALLSNVIVLQTDYDFMSNTTMYKCASSYFDQVPPGNIPPEYKAHLTYKPDSFQLIVWFERIEP